MLVTAIEARPIRSLDLELELGPGITSVVGANGAGKTNLLEALCFALTGRSFRTSDRRQLIPFGERLGRASATILDEGASRRFLASVSRLDGRRHLLDGAPVEARSATRLRPPVLVFAPDRLALVKGPPSERRAHLDAFVATRWRSRGGLRQSYGQALAQRNALLGRVAAGQAQREDLGSWDAALAAAAAPLIEAREEAVAELGPRFADAAEDLGLGESATLEYAPRAPAGEADLRAGLGERLAADLRAGRTTWGPHLDELRICSAGRQLRNYGSQGQQRLALLALLFAEREALVASGSSAPLMLLDDVMSELDRHRCGLLADRLSGDGQALITATEEASLPQPARAGLIVMPVPAAGAAALAA